MAGVYALTAADYGAAVAWVVPSFKNARAPWRFAESTTALIANRLRINRSERMIEFPSGGRVAIYSGDNDVALRGESFDLVIVDEAAQIKEETYSDVLLPTLADRDGRIMLISTPKGRNWFWREWMRGNADGRQMASFTAPTSANPIESIRRAAEMAQERVSERTYRQEWLAEFLEDGGVVFRRVSQLATAMRQDEPIDGHEYVIGVDWGRTVDFTVFAVVDRTTKELVYLERFNQIDYTLQRKRLISINQRFQPLMILAEANAMGQPIIDETQRYGVPVYPFTTGNQSKMQIIDALAMAFDDEEIRIINDPYLVNELNAYEMARTDGGLLKYGAPHGIHDDCVTATALAWAAANQPMRRRPRSREY